ncbi:MAG: M1 family aminopeptidase, partial [Crocinitomicaceae bacterium]
MKFLIPLLLLPFISFTQSQHQEIDVRSYALDISVNDSSNVIFGKNEVVVQFDKANAKELILDLVQPNDENKGMLVTSLRQDNKQVQFKQVNNQLIIELNTIPSNKKSTFDIGYHGIPTDGLVISENKFGVRTFFGDNWPNRAHHWFPCIDHPSDKATVSFKVTHPDEYTCVANGKFISRIPLKTGMTLTTYKSDYELPTKVTVFGLADLVSDTLSHPTNLEHVNFVYPQNKDAGFKDMNVAKDPLLFFETNIAAYPFEKLFNVQSTTRYGGMENAGCIFYDENAVTGEQGMENLIAHEIAHQWFGNSASEADWSHLWLSEGFATYFTNLHLEQKYGRAKMNEQLIKDRNRVIRFRQMVELPLKDTLTDEPLKM